MCTRHIKTYLVVAGSTRPSRRSPTIARWVATLGGEISGAAFQVIDLRDLGLAFDAEPGIPAKDDYVQETTRRWSALVRDAAGVVFVTPQYNGGYPAPLKNAIDHLYHEWKGKPTLIVSYGGRGGGKCAAQLRDVLSGMGLKLTEAMPGLKLAQTRIVANDGQVEPDEDFAEQRGEVVEALRELVVLPA
jgi:NAD(P)H-dependent FMN reductase